jgi:RNA polymerase sigma-70 factor (ECF subfamily)
MRSELEQVVSTAWREHRVFAIDLAFRMLGDVTEAEDVVQEAFARLVQTDAREISDVRGWLVVVVSRLCLDVLRSARVRRGVAVPDDDLERTPSPAGRVPDPADRVTLDDSVRSALLVVLGELSPAERTAFVLHDVFGYEFDTVGAIVGRSPQACRQLASRARHRVQAGTGPARFLVEPAEHRKLAERFISACAGGDLRSMIELLDPDVVVGVDLDDSGQPLEQGGRRLIRPGSRAVARYFLRFVGDSSGMTLVSNPLPDHVGLLAFQNGELLAAVDFEVRDGVISHIDSLRHPDRVAAIKNDLGLDASDSAKNAGGPARDRRNYE